MAVESILDFVHKVRHDGEDVESLNVELGEEGWWSEIKRTVVESTDLAFVTVRRMGFVGYKFTSIPCLHRRLAVNGVL